MALAILTLHHWDDWAAGLAELCRVAPRRVVLTMDFEMHASFWFLQDYVPEVREATRMLEPGYVTVAEAIGADVDAVIPLLVPGTCRTACSVRTGAGPRPTWTLRCGPTARGWRWPTLPSWLGAWLPWRPTWPAVRGSGATPTWPSCDAIDLGYRLVVADAG